MIFGRRDRPHAGWSLRGAQPESFSPDQSLNFSVALICGFLQSPMEVFRHPSKELAAIAIHHSDLTGFHSVSFSKLLASGRRKITGMWKGRLRKPLGTAEGVRGDAWSPRAELFCRFREKRSGIPAFANEVE